MSGPQKDVEKKIHAFAKNSGHCALRSKCGKTRDLLCSPKPMSFPSSMLGKPFDLWFFLRYHSGHVSWVSCLVGPPNEPPPEADFVLHT
jgi:hypothetical protein